MKPPKIAAAPCQSGDPDRFFTADDAGQLRAAKECTPCRALATCFLWGLRHERYGVYGGTTEDQRDRMRRHLGVEVRAPEVMIRSGRAA